MGGSEVCRVDVDVKDTFDDLRKAFMKEMKVGMWIIRVVLRSGRLLNAVCAKTPCACCLDDVEYEGTSHGNSASRMPSMQRSRAEQV